MSQSGLKDAKIQPGQPLKEDEKIPLFLIKLWNIVEDPAYYDVIRWDESGYSFHILDPYSFCRNVLPQYFKHNNLNSLIRQLNMYGFRKMTPIERTSLARSESDQDHLEFSHPCFVREHPELLVQIKRKAATNRQHSTEGTVSVSTKDLTGVFEELKRLRDRQKDMEMKISELTKENEVVWQEMGVMRGAHVKQQQIVTKLVQFMVTLLQPSSKRLGKRNILAIDESQPKRSRIEDPEVSVSGIGHHNVGEVLDRLMREYGSANVIHTSQHNQMVPAHRNTNVPIILDVTDELNNSAKTAQQSTNHAFYNPQYPQQSFYSQTNKNQPQNLMVNPNPPIYVAPSIAGNKRPPNVQRSVRQQLDIQPSGSYPPLSDDVQDTIPIVSSPMDNVLLSAATNEDPVITSSSDVFNGGFSPSEFSNYLDGMNTSIDRCHGAIRDRWDDLDLDGLLYDDAHEDIHTPGNISPQEQVSQHIQQPSTIIEESGGVNFVQPPRNLPYRN